MLNLTRLLIQGHGTDLGQFYKRNPLETTELRDYLINFVNTLDPNQGTQESLPDWPEYTNEDPIMLVTNPQQYGVPPITFTPDTYRSDAIDLLIDLSRIYPS